MWKLNSLSLKNRFSTLFFVIAIITTIVFLVLLIEHFKFGLNDSAKLRVITESNALASVYEQNPDIVLPSTYATNFYIDDLPVLIIQGINVFGDVSLSDGDFTMVFLDDYVEPSDGITPTFAIYCQSLFDGRTLYTVARYDLGLGPYGMFSQRLFSILFFLASYIIVTISILWYYNYKVSKRTGELVTWTKEVSSEFSEEMPDFTFDEYNQVATCLHDALRKNAELVDREKKFLSHASHELRTPIAVIRANMEILEKIEMRNEARVVVSRIDKASSNMGKVIETLLWLSRKSDNKPSVALVTVPALLDGLIKEQSYLLQGEAVEVTKEYGGVPERMLPVIPLRVVLGNLIRNAFQYTHNGWVRINYEEDSIIIENVEQSMRSEDYEVSFGFGLELTEKICKKLGWDLVVENIEGGVKAKLSMDIR
ncbi:HAMP domain-containing histidine kinase [Vibrio sp. JC009]|uniref:ATP-binding protein n=1 Tax=Vibrio sp. JC009 TaxID=2912314 RepID=UPI0023B1FC7C|nr:HAMP domain-containing sensor histidine kinase [Vibrio sp. JC009]WED23025.1 HAMP domain-containing histidine kinase [Vibrio sp. JC009]